jgi:DNA polymerase-1
LTGDTVDNIPGCPGVGPVKAYNILKDLHPAVMFDAVRQEYYDRGMTDEYLLEQGQLLWMTREFVDNEPVRWELPYESTSSV